MQIANPIYDITFKYLMENEEIAKDILSVILNEKNYPYRTKTTRNHSRNKSRCADF